MPNKHFNGIGSYWTHLFGDQDELEAFGFAARETLAAAYMRLSNLVLSMSHDDVPVFDRSKWDIVSLRASEVSIVSGQYRYPLLVAANNKGLRSAPLLLPSLAFPRLILVQGEDFVIDGGFISFGSDLFANPDVPVRDIVSDQEVSLWAPGSEVDTNRLWKFYGHFTKEWGYSTQAYKDFTRGLFHTFMFGPIHDRIDTGLQIMAGLPVASGGKGETVVSIEEVTDRILQQTMRWLVKTNIREYAVPLDVNIKTQPGDILKPFQTLTDAVVVSDYITRPNWWDGKILQLPSEIGTTSDINEAFDRYLKYNTFLIEANLGPFLGGMSGDKPFSANTLSKFVAQFKPSYTYFFMLYSLGFRDAISIDDYCGQDTGVYCVDFYTRPNCYYFGLGTDGDLFLYHFDGAEDFDGSIAMFSSIPNTNPLPQLYFDQPLMFFDGQKVFDGTEAFIGHDGSAVVFYCCDRDPLEVEPQIGLQDVVLGSTPLFNGDFAFNGEINWGEPGHPLYDVNKSAISVENKDDVDVSDLCLGLPAVSVESGMHEYFDGGLTFDNGVLFDQATLFNGRYKFDQHLTFGGIHDMVFDGGIGFDGSGAAVFDSYYDEDVNVDFGLDISDQFDDISYYFDGALLFGGSEERVFGQDRPRYDSMEIVVYSVSHAAVVNVLRG